MGNYESLVYDTYGKYRDTLKDIYGDLLLYEPCENSHISGAHSEATFIRSEQELIDKALAKGFTRSSDSRVYDITLINEEGIGINLIRIDPNIDRIVCFPLDEL